MDGFGTHDLPTVVGVDYDNETASDQLFDELGKEYQRGLFAPENGTWKLVTE